MNKQLQHLQRQSTPAKALVEPAPGEAELNSILQTAMNAPDHGRLYPYRFISIRGDARKSLSELFARAVKQRDPQVTDEYLKKQKDKPLRSPLIVVLVASPIESNKIPEIEQILSAGAAAHNILLASTALGYGSVWLTGDNAYDPVVKNALGLAEHESIIGFIYMGTQKPAMPKRDLPPVENKISSWNG